MISGAAAGDAGAGRGLRHGAGARRRSRARCACSPKSCASAMVLRAFIDAVRPTSRSHAPLFDEFGFAPGETADGIAASVWPLPGFLPDYFAGFARAAEAADAPQRHQQHPALWPTGLRRDRIRSAAGAACARLSQGRWRSLRPGEDLQEGAARPPAAICRSAIWPAAGAILEVCDRLALFRMLEGTRAALTIADWLIARYEQLKTRPRLPRLQRSDHPHRAACWPGRMPAPGCNTSSTRASTTSCSTRRRTPVRTSGRW